MAGLIWQSHISQHFMQALHLLLLISKPISSFTGTESTFGRSIVMLQIPRWYQPTMQAEITLKGVQTAGKIWQILFSSLQCLQVLGP